MKHQSCMVSCCGIRFTRPLGDDESEKKDFSDSTMASTVPKQNLEQRVQAVTEKVDVLSAKVKIQKGFQRLYKLNTKAEIAALKTRVNELETLLMKVLDNQTERTNCVCNERFQDTGANEDASLNAVAIEAPNPHPHGNVKSRIKTQKNEAANIIDFQLSSSKEISLKKRASSTASSSDSESDEDDMDTTPPKTRGASPKPNEPVKTEKKSFGGIFSTTDSPKGPPTKKLKLAAKQRNATKSRTAEPVRTKNAAEGNLSDETNAKADVHGMDEEIPAVAQNLISNTPTEKLSDQSAVADAAKTVSTLPVTTDTSKSRFIRKPSWFLEKKREEVATHKSSADNGLKDNAKKTTTANEGSFDDAKLASGAPTEEYFAENTSASEKNCVPSAGGSSSNNQSQSTKAPPKKEPVKKKQEVASQKKIRKSLPEKLEDEKKDDEAKSLSVENITSSSLEDENKGKKTTRAGAEVKEPQLPKAPHIVGPKRFAKKQQEAMENKNRMENFLNKNSEKPSVSDGKTDPKLSEVTLLCDTLPIDIPTANSQSPSKLEELETKEPKLILTRTNGSTSKPAKLPVRQSKRAGGKQDDADQTTIPSGDNSIKLTPIAQLTKKSLEVESGGSKSGNQANSGSLNGETSGSIVQTTKKIAASSSSSGLSSESEVDKRSENQKTTKIQDSYLGSFKKEAPANKSKVKPFAEASSDSSGEELLAPQTKAVTSRTATSKPIASAKRKKIASANSAVDSGATTDSYPSPAKPKKALIPNADPSSPEKLVVATKSRPKAPSADESSSSDDDDDASMTKARRAGTPGGLNRKPKWLKS